MSSTYALTDNKYSIFVVLQTLDVVMTWQELSFPNPSMIRLFSTMVAATGLRNDQGGSGAHFLHWSTASVCLGLNAHSAVVFGSIRGWRLNQERLLSMQFALSVAIWIYGMPRREQTYKLVGDRRFLKDTTSFVSKLHMWWVAPIVMTSWKRSLKFDDLIDFDIKVTAKKVSLCFNLSKLSIKKICMAGEEMVGKVLEGALPRWIFWQESQLGVVFVQKFWL